MYVCWVMLGEKVFIFKSSYILNSRTVFKKDFFYVICVSSLIYTGCDFSISHKKNFLLGSCMEQFLCIFCCGSNKAHVTNNILKNSRSCRISTKTITTQCTLKVHRTYEEFFYECLTYEKFSLKGICIFKMKLLCTKLWWMPCRF